MDGRETVTEVVDFSGRLILAVIGGLAVLALALALVIVAWISNAGHRKTQHAAPMPRAGVHGHVIRAQPRP